MKKRKHLRNKTLHIFIYLFLLCPIFLFSQNPWKQIAYLPDSNNLVNSIGFSIHENGYIVGGNQKGGPPWEVKRDFYRYNPLTDIWEKLADFPRFITKGVGFVIDSIAYITTGHDSSEYTEIDSLYAWNLSFNQWIVLGPIPSQLKRVHAVGFSINGKGYITTGISVNQSGTLKDLWEYNPSTNLWIQKANFPGEPRYDAACFTIANKAYVTLGSPLETGGPCTDLWEYDPAIDTWAQKTSFIAPDNVGATGFSIGDKGYITLGHSIEPPYIFYNAIWEYDPFPDQWLQLLMFPGTSRSGGSSFVINEIGYIVGGTFMFLPVVMDNWSFNSTLISIESKETKQYTIFPNPCSSTIYIKLPYLCNGKINVYFFNVSIMG